MRILTTLFFGLCLLMMRASSQQLIQKNIPNNKVLDLSGMDSSVRPGDNFYRYVNGKWISKAVIPPSESGVGVLGDLYNSTQDNLHSLLDSLSGTNQVNGTIEQKVGDLYASGMDTVTIEKRGYEPLKPYLEKIAAIQSVPDILKFANILRKENQNLIYVIRVVPDAKNSKMNILSLRQGGLALPDRDYYFKKDSSGVAILEAYHRYIATLFMLCGDDSATAAKQALKVFNLEKQLAEVHMTRVERRDPRKTYHKMSMAELDKQMPAISWKSTLSDIGIHTDSVNLDQPAYYIRLNQLLTGVGLDDWKAYLEFHTIWLFVPYLSSSFVNADFNLYDRTIFGQEQMKPRWYRMVSFVDDDLGDGLGEVYVNRYFTAASKARMLELVNNLQTAFEMRINKLDWMSDSTKAKAKDKLHTYIKKIGYPDKWRDYSTVSIDKHKYFENFISCLENEFNRKLVKINKPVDKSEWGMTAPTINAYYDPKYNEIVFPAGFLQPPYFNPAADDAVNYGAIGIIIGHEMTHGFDDQGAQFDKEGNLKNWWSHDDSVKFVSKTKLVEAQYDRFVVIDTIHVNGAVTLGENIADLGGLNIAYDAFKLTKQGQDTIRIDGLTPDERFFLSYATVRRSKLKDALLRANSNLDQHSPDEFRVIGPLQNFTPFYITFNVKEGDKMYKPETERIKIW